MRGFERGTGCGAADAWRVARVLGLGLGLGGAASACGVESDGLFGEAGDESSGAAAGTGASSATGGAGGLPAGGSSGAVGGSTGDAGGGAGGGAGGSHSGSGGGTETNPGVSAATLLALTEHCDPVGGDYSTDYGAEADISICALEGAVFFHADMDIDCDGYRTAECNEDTDPWFYAATAMGDHIAAAELPYVVLPLPSERFNASDFDIELGAVVAVIYQGQLRYGAFVDLGPKEIIGEASYAMAELFGIDPNPATGGTSERVTYIAFSGESARVPEHEILDHARAVDIGKARAAALLNAD